MNSYIEVAWLIMTLIAISSNALAASLISRTVNWKRLVGISAFSSALAVLGYRRWYWVFLAETLQCLALYPNRLKAMLQMELTRLFFLTAGKVWARGVLVNLVLFVPDRSTRWISYVVFLLIAAIVFQKWAAPRIFKETFQMPITLKIQGRKLTLRGYLDSGNSLKFKNCPVVFLACRYAPLIEGMKGTAVSYRTVNSKNQCFVYPCEISTDGSWKRAYVAFSSQLEQPIDCLLNSRLFC